MPYLQQLEMESNGKRVDREGRFVDYATAPILWGARERKPAFLPSASAPGHACCPIDFIDLAQDKILSANLQAQADALAHGTDDPKLAPHRRYPGNRPSSILYFEGLSPRNLGRLVALYEHKVFTQGVVWNINSFDHWVFELGKELATKILKGDR